MESIFGPLLSSWNVDQAVLATLRVWWRSYMAEVERQNGVPKGTIPRPPDTESFRRGLDFEYYEEDDLPAVIVVSKPSGEPEVSDAGYVQRFEVKVGIVCEAEDELTAQLRAAFCGAASQLLVQQSELEGFAERTRMIGAPELEMPDDEERWLCRAVTTFYVWVAPVVIAEEGPIEPPGPGMGPGGEDQEPEEPYPPWPEAASTHITVTGEPIAD
jgi:hypothetical protein